VRLGVDTNVLVYAHVASAPEHESVRSFVGRQLADPANALVITPMVLHEFVHVVTDARRFQRPVAMAEALAVAGGWLGRANVECLAIDEEAMRRTLDLLQLHRLGRKRIADTLLAATLIRHEVREIVTCNAEDFRIFPELSTIDPRR
jgi:toxin-antitoxin system PIN domain toxin